MSTGTKLFSFVICCIIIIGMISVLLFSGGLPNLFSFSTGGSNSIGLHIEVLDQSHYSGSFPYVNLTDSEINSCPVFSSAMAKIQSFTNGTISIQITHEEESCISQVLSRASNSSQPVSNSIFRYKNEFYTIGFAVA